MFFVIGIISQILKFCSVFIYDKTVSIRKLSNYLRQKQLDLLDDSSAFMMMYDLDPENIERFILYPYLQEVFDNTPNEEQFWKYFYHGYCNSPPEQRKPCPIYEYSVLFIICLFLDPLLIDFFPDPNSFLEVL